MSQKAGQHLAVNNGACWIRQMAVGLEYRNHFEEPSVVYRSGHMLTQNITVISVLTHSHKKHNGRDHLTFNSYTDGRWDNWAT